MMNNFIPKIVCNNLEVRSVLFTFKRKKREKEKEKKNKIKLIEYGLSEECLNTVLYLTNMINNNYKTVKSVQNNVQ